MSNAIAREIELKMGKPAGWMDQPASSDDLKTRGGSNAEFSVPTGVRRVPLISYVQAGNWTVIADSFQTEDASDWLITSDKHSSGTF